MNCIICGGDNNLLTITKLIDYVAVFNKGKITPEDIESVNVYCNQCFESVIWMKGNKSHED